MPIQISCPTCTKQLRVPDNLVGQMVKCPSCQNTFTAAVEETPGGGKADPFAFQEQEQEAPRERPVSRRPRRDDDDDDDDLDRPRRRHSGLTPHRGQLIMILGILSIVGVGAPITGIVAWILGNGDLKEMRAGRMDREGEGNTSLGRTLGIISTILWLIIPIGCGGCFCVMSIMSAGAR